MLDENEEHGLLTCHEIGNGCLDSYVQAPYYPKFATENTYGIVSVNQTVHDYMEFALNMNTGCLQQIEYCRSVLPTAISTLVKQAICAEAADMCGDNVEGKQSSSALLLSN